MRALGRELGATVEFAPNIKGGNDGSESLLDLNASLDEQVRVLGCVYPEMADQASLDYFTPDMHTCMAGNASCYISPDGTVQPCLDWLEPAGNIRDGSIAEIWASSPVFLRARGIRRSSFEGCSSCENFGACSLCPARAYRETGSPTGSAPSKCRETTAKRIAHQQSTRTRPDESDAAE